MKSFFILFTILGLLGVSMNASADDQAIAAFKSEPKVEAFLADKTEDKYWVRFEKIKLGDICGIAGCQWRTLVSMIVTSKSANAPSVSFFAIVEGPVPVAKDAKPQVRFVELTEMEEQKWQTRI